LQQRPTEPARYSDYSELWEFRRKRENSVHLGGQECRPKRRSSVFSIEVQVPKLDRPLSYWNHQVFTGEIPAVVMNATIAETGERLLLCTTSFGAQSPAGKARVDAEELHRINCKDFDVGIATAARLSATFPYVTPASRSNGPGSQPHVVDGGYYDNYGMASLVEWLDEALTGSNGAITEVPVLQIHGAPVDDNPREQRYGKTRGWFYQAIAPLSTLAAVRTAGQIAHNQIELELLRQKWAAKNVTIESVTFEFSNQKAPLSWHLTPEEVTAIGNEWASRMGSCRRRVRSFLAGTGGTRTSERTAHGGQSAGTA
jgi:hypothetical protein